MLALCEPLRNDFAIRRLPATIRDGRSGPTMDRDAVLQRIVEIGIIPVLRAERAEDALVAVDVLCESGIPVVEVTTTVPGRRNGDRANQPEIRLQAIGGRWDSAQHRAGAAVYRGRRVVPGKPGFVAARTAPREEHQDARDPRSAVPDRGDDGVVGRRDVDEGLSLRKRGRPRLPESPAWSVSRCSLHSYWRGVRQKRRRLFCCGRNRSRCRRRPGEY